MTAIQPHALAMPVSVSPAPAHAPGATRRRRRPLGQAAAGVAELARPTQQLPFRAAVGVRISNSLLYPIAGAVLGTLLLGLPGTIIGGIVGAMLA